MATHALQPWRWKRCAISGFVAKGIGVVSSAHIYDRWMCLRDGLEDGVVSESNRLPICQNYHILFDRRIITIDADTGVLRHTALSFREMEQLNLKPGTRIDSALLTPERRTWLRMRENDYSKYLDQLAAYNRRKQRG